MNNPGTFSLGAAAITTPLAGETITEGVSPAGCAQAFIDNLDGMLSAYIVCDFAYGSGGTNCIVTIQTTVDGTIWRDAARFDFATSSLRQSCTLSGLTPKGITTHSALASAGVNDGELGGAWRAVVTSEGVYANTTVAVRLRAA